MIGKILVLGLLKRGGKVHMKVIADASEETLMPVIKSKVIPDSIVYSDCREDYNTPDISDFRHFRINHLAPLTDNGNHINGIKNF